MKKLAILTAAVLSAALMTGCGGGKTAMKMGDIKITQSDIKFLTEIYSGGADFDMAKDYVVTMFEDSLKNYFAATKKGVELTEDDKKMVRQSLASMKSQMGGTKAFEKELKKAGASEEALELVMGAGAYQSKLAEELAIPTPSDEEAEKFFKENYYRAKHVLLLTETEDPEFVKSRAEDVLKRAKAGENFDEMITNLSEDPGSASQPDGYIFTDGDMVPEFYDAVASVKPGEFAMCQSSYGYHVVQRLAIEGDAKYAEFWEQNKATAVAKLQGKQFEDEMNKILEAAGLTLEKFDDAITAIASPTPEATAEPAEEATDDAVEESANDEAKTEK